MINDMHTEDVILLFDQLYPGGETEDAIGEKDFFEFMKRANRDLTAHQRYRILNKTINMIRKGESNDK